METGMEVVAFVVVIILALVLGGFAWTIGDLRRIMEDMEKIKEKLGIRE